MDSMSSEVQRTTSTYDVVAAEYARRTERAWPSLIDRVDAFAERVGRGGSVLDLGCGPGRDSRLLRDRGVRVVGLDRSRGMLEAGLHVGALQGDMRSLPIRSGGVDGVWSQAALLHVPRQDMSGVLGDVHRVLRPNGALSVTTAGGTREGGEDDAYGRANPRWFVYHTEAGLWAAFRESGFQVEEIIKEQTNRSWISVLARRT
jgi:SAM-dependent methyltransferase